MKFVGAISLAECERLLSQGKYIRFSLAPKNETLFLKTLALSPKAPNLTVKTIHFSPRVWYVYVKEKTTLLKHANIDAYWNHT